MDEEEEAWDGGVGLEEEEEAWAKTPRQRRRRRHRTAAAGSPSPKSVQFRSDKGKNRQDLAGGTRVFGHEQKNITTNLWVHW